MISTEQKALNGRFLTAYDYLESIGQIKKNASDSDVTTRSRTSAAMCCFECPPNHATIYMRGVRLNTRGVPFDGAIRFCEAFGLSKYWMIFGEGEMIDEQKSDT